MARQFERSESGQGGEEKLKECSDRNASAMAGERSL